MLTGSVHVDPAPAGFRISSASRARRAAARTGMSRSRQAPATRSGSPRSEGLADWAREGGASAAVVAARASTRPPGPGEPARRDAGRVPRGRASARRAGRPARARAGRRLRPRRDRAARARDARRASRRDSRVSDPWVGKDESGGIPIEPLPGAEPPEGWRLEAIAATERPRSLTLGADGRTAVYIHDRDTSDIWLLDLATRRARTAHDRPRPDAVLGGHRSAPLARRIDSRLRRRRPRLRRSGGGRPAAAARRGLGPGLDRRRAARRRASSASARAGWSSWTSPTPGRGCSQATRARRRGGAGRLAGRNRGRLRVPARATT